MDGVNGNNSTSPKSGNNNNSSSNSSNNNTHKFLRKNRGFLLLIFLLVSFTFSAQIRPSNTYTNLDREMASGTATNAAAERGLRYNSTVLALQSLIKSQATRELLATIFTPYKPYQTFHEWRLQTEQKCKTALDSLSHPDNERDAFYMKENTDAFIISQLQVPIPEDLSYELPKDHLKYDNCKNAFIDLGTNIGDTIAYFVENAIDICTPIWRKEEEIGIYYAESWFPRPRLDLDVLRFDTWGKSMNPTHAFLQQVMTQYKIRPENTCVYGVEGNPRFTKKLQRYENFLSGLYPSPFQHLHIHTETVITKTNGPTQLYLDETSVEHNFWGSSIVGSLLDAKETAEKNNGTAKSANVQGLTLTSLIQNTMAPFQDGAKNKTEDKSGGHLIIKMDVEGAEYDVLREVTRSNVFCDYIKYGNKISIIVEFHGAEVITDEEEYKQLKKGTGIRLKELQDCGVEFRNLDPTWS